MAAVILNVINAVLIIGAVIAACRKAESEQKKKRVVLRYFTVLSNLLCALASLTAAACRTAEGIAFGASLFKFVATCAVTVTLLTVFLFLGRAYGGVGELLKGQDLFLHLICPLLAIISYCFFDRVRMGAAYALLGALPVLLYGILYMYKVLFAPESSRWEDFYTFNRGGKWPVAFAAMLIAAIIISFILWLL